MPMNPIYSETSNCRDCYKCARVCPVKAIRVIDAHTDQIELVVGTQINDETTDPGLAAKIGVRLPLVEQITRSLEQRYFKEVTVRYL